MVFKCNQIEMLDCADENNLNELFEQSLELIEKRFAEKLSLSNNVSFGDDSKQKGAPGITDINI